MIQLTLLQKIVLISSIVIIELIFFLFINLFGHWIIIIIVELILHYGIIFFIVNGVFFSGGVWLITRYHCRILGIKIAESFKGQLAELISLINGFFTSNTEIYNIDDLLSKSSILGSINDLINSYISISNNLSKLSHNQMSMMISLNRLKMSLEECQFAKCIEKAIKDIQTSKRTSKIDIRSKQLDAQLHKIISNIEEINLILETLYLYQGNIFKKFIYHLCIDTFGSLNQLKCELMTRFNCESFKVPIAKRVELDCLLIKPSSQVPTREKKETVMIICNRSSCPYELFAYYDNWIECYLSYKISIVLWNYRGYGESTGYSTLSNIQSDSSRLIEFITEKYSFKKFGVHGISLGAIPAAYLVKEKKVTFCFADRTFDTIESLVNNKLFSYAYWLLKPFLIQNVDITDMLLSQKDATVFKVISYDLKKDYIDDAISLKTGIAQRFFKSIDQFSHNNNNGKSFLEILLNETGREYETFEKDIEYLLTHINNPKEENDNKIEVFSMNKDMQIPSLDNQIQYKALSHNPSNTDGSIAFSNDISILNSRVYSDSRMKQMIKGLFDKFDAGGETLLSLLNTNNKKQYVNNFFLNMLAWGSFQIGQVYATDKLIAYRAIAKKMSFVNQKISRIIADPTKYQISDPVFSSSLQSLLNALIKIETFFNSILFEKLSNANGNLDMTLGEIHGTSTNSDLVSPSDTTSGDISLSFQGSTLHSNSDSYRNAQLSSFIKNANIGNLLLLNCGHEGLYTAKELEMYSMYLLNSSFIN